MSTHTSKEPSEIEKHQAAQKRLDRAYAALFGADPAKRTEDQRLVWADMQHRGYIHRTTLIPDGEGKLESIRVEAAEGMRLFQLQTQDKITRATAPVSEKPKRKTIKS